MTKNEVVARWTNKVVSQISGDEVWIKENPINHVISKLDMSDYNLLHEAWVKFRDLKFTKAQNVGRIHECICNDISTRITHGTITEAFDELVKGIEWYNSLNNKT